MTLTLDVISCLLPEMFGSELTSGAHGHAVYLCLCLCLSTPVSSVFILVVSVLTWLQGCCSSHSSSSWPACALTWLDSWTQSHLWKCLSKDHPPPPRPPLPLVFISPMTALLSLFMSKWQSNYFLLMSVISGMWSMVRLLLHFSDNAGMLWQSQGV